MKFLCPSCKAKYQIADEKVQGRTLRMRCRRCEHHIVIKPDAAPEAEGVAGEAPASKKTASGMGPPPSPVLSSAPRRGSAFGNVTAPAAAKQSVRASAGSALGSDFRKQVAGAPEAQKPTTTLDAWHVAIHDVPVGPMRREEIAKKIASGAVTSESLVWREGLDDWRPLQDVPELASLMRSLTPPAGTGKGGSRGGSGARGRPTPPAPQPTRQPTRSNVVPIGGRMGASSAPTLDEFASEMPDEPTRVSPGLPFEEEAAAPAPEALGSPGSLPMDGATSFPALTVPTTKPNPEKTEKRGLPVGAWIAISGSVAFGIALAFVIGTRVLRPDPPQTVTVIETRPVAPSERPVEPATAPPPTDPNTVQEAAPTGTETTVTVAPSRTGHTKTRTPTPTKQSQQLTAEQQRLREELGAGLGGQASQLRIRSVGEEEEQRRGGTGDLSADQIRPVVTRNRPQIQQCYETAARAAGVTDTLRLDVDLHIGPSGTVTRVTTRGASVGNLSRCIERVVRGWRFPSSGSGGDASFPFVLQPGGR